MRLSEEELKSLNSGFAVPVEVPGVQANCVLIREDIYDEVFQQHTDQTEDHLWLRFAGCLKDEPLVPDWRQAMSTNRDQVDLDTDT